MTTALLFALLVGIVVAFCVVLWDHDLMRWQTARDDARRKARRQREQEDALREKLIHDAVVIDLKLRTFEQRCEDLLAHTERLRGLQSALEVVA